MHVHESGKFYELYIKSDFYFGAMEKSILADTAGTTKVGEKITKEQELAYADLAKSYEEGPFGGLNDMIEKISSMMPELKNVAPEKIVINILPESVPSITKNAIGGATKKMQERGETQDIMASVLGVVAVSFTADYDATGGGGMMEITNDKSVYQRDVEQLKKTIDSFRETYGETSTWRGLHTFVDDMSVGMYGLDMVWDHLSGEERSYEEILMSKGEVPTNKIKKMIEDMIKETENSVFDISPSTENNNASMASLLQKEKSENSSKAETIV